MAGVTDIILKEIYSLAPYLQKGEREDLSSFVYFFRDYLACQTEYSITPVDESLGVMIKGSQDPFGAITAEFLEDSGFSGDVTDRFLKIHGEFAGLPLFVKRDFHPDGRFKFTLYWQGLVPLKFIESQARELGISRETLDFLSFASALFRTDSLYGGLSLKPPGEMSFKVFFAPSMENSRLILAPAVSAVMARCGIDQRNINYFIDIYNLLQESAKGSLFISLGAGSRVEPGVKTDFEIVDPKLAQCIMNRLNMESGAVRRMDEAMNILEMEKLTYLGIKFIKDRPLALKFYLDRRFGEKNRDNAGNLANFLTDTIWTV